MKLGEWRDGDDLGGVGGGGNRIKINWMGFFNRICNHLVAAFSSNKVRQLPAGFSKAFLLSLSLPQPLTEPAQLPSTTTRKPGQDSWTPKHLRQGKIPVSWIHSLYKSLLCFLESLVEGSHFSKLLVRMTDTKLKTTTTNERYNSRQLTTEKEQATKWAYEEGSRHGICIKHWRITLSQPCEHMRVQEHCRQWNQYRQGPNIHSLRMGL